MCKRLIVAGALCAAKTALPVVAVDLGIRASPTDEAVASRLKPGEFIWNPALAAQGPMLMIINLRTQRAYVYRNGIRIGVSTISSGKTGYKTPTGAFTILEKRKAHRSNKYNNAPMPYMQRLTWYGIALHGGHLPGHPASHGCVRLPHAFAEALFKETMVGMKVVITNEPLNEKHMTVSSKEREITTLQSCGRA